MGYSLTNVPYESCVLHSWNTSLYSMADFLVMISSEVKAKPVLGGSTVRCFDALV